MSNPRPRGEKGRFVPMVVEPLPETAEVNMLNEAQAGHAASQRMLAAAEADVAELTQHDQFLTEQMDAIAERYQQLSDELLQVRSNLSQKRDSARALTDAVDAFADVIKLHAGQAVIEPEVLEQ